MVKEAHEEEVLDELLSAHLCGRRLQAGHEGAPFEEEHEGDAEHERHDGDPVVEVQRAHAVHEVLAVDCARRESHVGSHGRREPEPREGELRGGREPDAHHDRDERGVHRESVELLVDKRGANGGKDGLERLDGVRERYGDGGEGHVCEAVAKRVQEGRERQLLEKLLIGLLVRHELRAPEETHHKETNRQVNARNEPREREEVVDGLVDEVELDVEKVPEAKVHNRLGVGVNALERV
mmetsp:Transcript_12142/g.39924  ORF Transcript_12142/g.39924 Transcript_12142/m.39924 type:complete len:238 (-) Transcript_12142:270-983(-)